MRHLTASYDEELYSGNIFRAYFDGLKIGVLDIETTGLDPSRNKFILGGLLDMESRTLHQYFAETRGEEEEALRAFAARVAGLDMVITYNGRHFDMPFINRRMKNFAMGSCSPYDLDIYLILNGHSPIKKFLPNLKQKSVENYMGLWQTRTDEISGLESVELYNSYEKSGDENMARKILLHNSDDVIQLTRLLTVLNKADLHKAMFHLGFPAGPLIVEKIRIDSASMAVTGIQRKDPIDYTGFAFGGFASEIHMDKRTASFSMKFPLIRESGLTVVDLESAGLDTGQFEKYPSCGSGFLVVEDHGNRKCMEINHFIKAFITSFINNI